MTSCAVVMKCDQRWQWLLDLGRIRCSALILGSDES